MWDPDSSSVTSGIRMERGSLTVDNVPAHLLSGGLAGIAEHCVMYPVDCIKV